MQWSKLKARVEAHFAPSVAGRVELRLANYRHVHDGEGRGWVTLDGEEIASFCTLRYWVERNRLEEGIREANAATDWRDPATRPAYDAAGEAVQAILDAKGNLHQKQFEADLESYLSLSVEDGLASESLVHRALAVIDRRLGKRRLRTLDLRTDEHPLVVRLLSFRRTVEGLPEPSMQRSDSEQAAARVEFD